MVPVLPQRSRRYAGLFLASTALLTLEILQTKICAFSLDALRIYLAIGLCMLGLGAAATMLAIAPAAPRERIRPLASFFAFAAALGIPLAHLVFARYAGTLGGGGILAVATQTALAVPYFCFGVTITLLLVSEAESIGRAYAVNMAGSGFGCLIIFPLLDTLGAERLLLLVSGMAFIAAMVLAMPRRLVGRGAAVALALALAVFAQRAPALFVFPPEPLGQLNIVLNRTKALQERYPDTEITAEPVLSRWDQTARVDVYRFEASTPELGSRIGDPLDILIFMQDASAGSNLLGVRDDLSRAREFFDKTLYGVGYVQHPVQDALVIGLGGAPDIQTALHHGARSVTGVEINRATINLVREDFAEFLGDPYGQPGVEIHQMDGRTFLRSTGGKYDLIQMSGVDTKSLLASGSLAINELYVYTTEAMTELLGHLRPDGVLSILRFNDADAHRLTSLGVEGLREIGVEDPRRHVVTIGQGRYFRSVLVKRTPFTPVELERLRSFVNSVAAAPPKIVIPALDWLDLHLARPLRFLYAPAPLNVATTPYFQAFAKDRLDSFLYSHEIDLTAPVDDRPFFFFTIWPRTALISPPPVLKQIYWIPGQLAIVSLIFILLPLVALRRRGLRAPLAGRTLVHFACLGAGFMLAEIGLIHRFVLLLGHQSYAVTVVLVGILVGASLGSLYSQRLSIASAGSVRTVIGALVAVIVIYALGLPTLFDAFAAMGFGVRLMLALALVIALGAVLGVPFPTGLRALQGHNQSLVAWAIGINGLASVVGSTGAVPMAMIIGLRALLGAAALLYVIALLTTPVGRLRTASQAGVDGSPAAEAA